MLQLRRIRTVKKTSGDTTYDTNFEPDIMVESHVELFANLQTYIDKIPEFERYNCHYTLGDSPGGKKRGKGSFTTQRIIPFDIDGIEFSDEPSEIKNIIQTVSDVFYRVSGFDPGASVRVLSGHGLHFLVAVDEWSNKDYFRKNAKAYSALCGKIEEGLRAAGVKFKELDRAVFAPNHMLRLPGTLNKKPGKKDRKCVILGNTKLTKQEAPWGRISVPKGPAKTSSREEKSSRIDTNAVLDGCEFLKYTAENQEKVNEAQWYASLSVWGRLSEGRTLCHKNSSKHPKYNLDETETKINQALGPDSGPRTCENIGTLWAGCDSCVHKGKVTSPIQIRGEEFIATEKTGFMYLDPQGKKKPVPQYDDLVKFFEREHPYITNRESGEVYVFDGKKYSFVTKNSLRGFAGKHFFPQPNENAIQEFVSRVNRKNHEEPSFLEVSENFINFDNGILDVTKGELLPHSPEFGFLYVLPYAYEPRAKCPEFDAMMGRITCGDKDIEQVLLEYTGYALCDRTFDVHKALILIGEGSNGKSTFLEIVKALAGKENFSAIGIKELDKDTNRAMLEGKLVNISDEMPNLAMQDTDIFKKMMGGSITIRRLYGMPTVYRCTTKLMFAANEIPETRDYSHGMLRRLLIVPFDARFNTKDRDIGLMKRVLSELPGIFNRVLDAHKTFQKRGDFKESARCSEQLNAYRAENDEIGDTLSDMLTVKPSWGPDDWVPFTDLFNKLVPNIGSRLGDRDRYTKRFRKALARAVPDLKKRTFKKWVANLNGGTAKIQAVGYFGIGVRNEHEGAYTNGKSAEHSTGFSMPVENSFSVTQ